ncbi:MAG: cytochrome P450, partial [Candidatus Dadabacteria bacterium]
DYTKELTTYTSTRCLLGKEFREHLTSEFAAVYKDLEHGVSPIAVMNPHLPLPAFRRRDRARVKLGQMIGGIIDARRAQDVVGDDFMQTLMDARYKDGRAPTSEEITGILIALMFAGHHTSSVTAAWTMLELLRHPAILQRVLDELDCALGDAADFSFDALRKLDLLERVVKETLRLHPPLIMLTRRVMHDFEYKGWVLPKGFYAVVCPNVSHMVPEEFANPERFDPDRWLPERGEITSPFKWVAFGGGRHKCTGNAFALMQIKTIFAVLLRNFRFESVGDPVEAEYQNLVVGPKPPARVRYTRIRG